MNSQQLNAVQDKKTRRGIRVKPEAVLPVGETVSQSIGTLASLKTVHIQFQVTVNTPYLGGANVSNQGTVSGSNFASVLTDDPAVGGASDPTLTPDPPLSRCLWSQTLRQMSHRLAQRQCSFYHLTLGSGRKLRVLRSITLLRTRRLVLAHASRRSRLHKQLPDTVLNFAAGEQFKDRLGQPPR